ncbi:MAG: PKD domain-containing protein [Thermoplasmatota archaeon]
MHMGRRRRGGASHTRRSRERPLGFSPAATIVLAALLAALALGAGSSALAASAACAAPSIHLAPPTVVGRNVAVDGNATAGAPCTITRIVWSWGDSSTPAAWSFPANHAYAAAGQYQIRATVVQDDGQDANTTAAVTIAGKTFSTQAEGTVPPVPAPPVPEWANVSTPALPVASVATPAIPLGVTTPAVDAPWGCPVYLCTWATPVPQTGVTTPYVPGLRQPVAASLPAICEPLVCPGAVGVNAGTVSTPTVASMSISTPPETVPPLCARAQSACGGTLVPSQSIAGVQSIATANETIPAQKENVAPWEFLPRWPAGSPAHAETGNVSVTFYPDANASPTSLTPWDLLGAAAAGPASSVALAQVDDGGVRGTVGPVAFSGPAVEIG